MKRTSATHPLQINAVAVPGTTGQIGMTLCPGKVQSNALSGTWDRDLEADMEAIEHWGASTVISLMEPHELKAVKVPHLPHRASAKMQHYALPIRDGGTPEAKWEAAWAQVGPEVRETLQQGGKVLIHCLGGLGRTGLLAAKLLVEFGMEPKKAMAAVRNARPDTIENTDQEAYVLAQKPAEKEPARMALKRPYHRIDPAMASRFRGCLLGGAVGDALGAPVEFMDLKAILAKFGPEGIRDYVPAYGRRGAITDDTQMTLFTAEGIMRAYVRGLSGFPGSIPGVIADAYQRWYATQGGTVKISGVQMDGWLISHKELFASRAPGNTCLAALKGKRQTREDAPAMNDSKGCGGVMRVAPVGLYAAALHLPYDQIFSLGCEAAALTHGHPTGQYPAGVLAVLVAAVAQGVPLLDALSLAKKEVRRCPNYQETLEAIEAAEALAIAPTPSEQALLKLGQGWIAEEALAIALFCTLRARNLEEGVVMAVNISGDSDSTGAIAGNLLGAMQGAHEIPERWLAPLELREVIQEMADDLATIRAWPISQHPHDTKEKIDERAYWCEKYPIY